MSTKAYLVCKGAFCECTLGSAPAQLIPASDKHYVNDSSGSTKSIATVKDKNFAQPFFGTCPKLNNGPCKFAALSDWEIEEKIENHPAINNALVLTSSGRLKCANGGEITVIIHGQTRPVKSIDMDDYSVDIATSVNCLIPSSSEIKKDEKDKKIPSVQYIESKSVKSNAKNKENIPVLVNDKLSFTATINSGGDEEKVSWAVKKANEKGWRKFDYLGTSLTLSWKTAGEYKVVGYGTKPEDESCTLNIEVVKENKFSHLMINGRKVTTNVLLGPLSQNLDKAQIQTIYVNDECKIIPKTLLGLNDKPFIFKNVLPELCVSVYNGINTALIHQQINEDEFSLKTDQETEYRISIFYYYQRVADFPIQIVENDVASISPSDLEARCGSRIVFSADLEKALNSKITETEKINIHKKIRWFVDGIEQKSNNEGTLSLLFDKEKTYKIEAKYKSSLSTKTISRVIESKKNYLEGNIQITPSIRGNKGIIGQTYKIKVITHFPYTVDPELLKDQRLGNTMSLPQRGYDSLVYWNIKYEALDGNITSEPYSFDLSKIPPHIRQEGNFYDVNEIEITKFKAGKYTICAEFEGKVTNTYDLIIDYSEVKKWRFVDSNGYMLKRLGWNQKFNIEICIPQWSGLYLDAYLYVVDGNTCEKIALVELGKEQKMDYFGELSLEVGTDHELWRKLTGGQIDKAYITLVIKSKYPIKDQYFIEAGMPYYYPMSGGESIFPQVWLEPDLYYEGRFVDEDGFKLKRVIQYGEPARIQMHILNGKNEKQQSDIYKYYLTLVENLKANDKETYLRKKEVIPNEEGFLSEEINTKDLGEDTHETADRKAYTPRLFYFLLERKAANGEDSEENNLVYVYPEFYMDIANIANRETNDDYIIDLETEDDLEEAKQEEESVETADKEPVEKEETTKEPTLETNDVSVVSEVNQSNEQKADEKNTEKILKIKSQVNYFLQLKIAKETNLNRSLSSISPVMIGEELSPQKENRGCPRCNKPITVEELQTIFPKVKIETLADVADIYNTYMEETGLNTCWNKAHFFAQAAVETGYKLEIGNGENFNYYWEVLIDKFGAFQTDEGKKKAKEFGRKIRDRRDPKCVDVPLETQKKIANYVYGPPAAKAVELDNKEVNDGWTYRGQGIMQLTGKGAYKYANDYTLKEGADIVANPSLVSKDIRIGVLSAMAFWVWKGLNTLSNGERYVEKKICSKVGNDVGIKDRKGKDTTNHREKQRVFAEETSKLFDIENCEWAEDIDCDNSDLKIQEGIEWLLSKAVDQSEIVTSDNSKNIKTKYKVTYANDENRIASSGENTMDCSELVSRYLQKIEWSSKVIGGVTSILTEIGEKHKSYLCKHSNVNYKPQKGDIFIWKSLAGGMGHTGVIIDYDEKNDVVTTVEALSTTETPEGITAKNGIYMHGVVKLKWERNSKHLTGHPLMRGKNEHLSACRFYTPLVHYSQADKKIVWKNNTYIIKIIINKSK